MTTEQAACACQPGRLCCLHYDQTRREGVAAVVHGLRKRTSTYLRDPEYWQAREAAHRAAAGRSPDDAA